MLVWNVDKRECLHRFTVPSLQASTAIAISPGSTYLAYGYLVAFRLTFALTVN